MTEEQLKHLGDLGGYILDLTKRIAELEAVAKKPLPEKKPDYYTVKEASEILRCSNTSIYRLIESDCLKTQKGFRHKRISRASVELWMKQTTL